MRVRFIEWYTQSVKEFFILCIRIPFLMTRIMEKIIDIPEGYEARIEGGKVILEEIESEDEKTKRELLELIQYRMDTIPTPDHRSKADQEEMEKLKRWRAFLERQKEQQPVPISCSHENGKPAGGKEDENMYIAISIALTMPDAEGYLGEWHITPEDADNWLKCLINR